ncbi:MAG: trimethylamine methyltransferase family protein, partial [Ilumatobacteraceae bacterium]
MSDVHAPPARRGGREARRALRAAPLARDVRPVNPGMSGGRYKVLSDAEVLKVHEAALNVLENIGLADAIPSCIELLTAKGCTMTPEGRMLFPRALVEDTLAIAGRHFPLYAQDPQYDMEPWGTNVYYGTAGAAVQIIDPVTGAYRESNAQ